MLIVEEWHTEVLAAIWRGVSLLLLIKLSALYTLPSSEVEPDLPLKGRMYDQIIINYFLN